MLYMKEFDALRSVISCDQAVCHFLCHFYPSSPGSYASPGNDNSSDSDEDDDMKDQLSS